MREIVSNNAIFLQKYLHEICKKKCDFFQLGMFLQLFNLKVFNCLITSKGVNPLIVGFQKCWMKFSQMAKKQRIHWNCCILGLAW